MRQGPAPRRTSHLALPPGLTLDQIADRVGQLPGHGRDAFLPAASGVVRSALQPADTTSLEGLHLARHLLRRRASETDLPTIVPRSTSRRRGRPARGRRRAHVVRQTVEVASLVQAEVARPRTRRGRRRSSPTVCSAACRCRSTRRSATRRAAARRCRTTPTSRSTRRTTRTRSSALPPTPIMTVTEPALSAAAHRPKVPYLYYVTGKDGVTRFATTAGRARAEHQGARGERRMNGRPRSTRLARGSSATRSRHSRSPAIHNAAFAAAGLDWVFVAFPVPAGSGECGGESGAHARAGRHERHHAAQGRRGVGLRRGHARGDRPRRGERDRRRSTAGALAGHRPTARASSAASATRASTPLPVRVLVLGAGRRGAGDRARARAGGRDGHGRGAPARCRRIGRRPASPAPTRCCSPTATRGSSTSW